MAEGVPKDLDPTELNKTKDDDDGGNNDTFYLTPTRTSTTYQNPGYDEYGDRETSFGGREYEKEGARPKTKSGYTQLPSEEIEMGEIERNKDEAWDNILKMCPRAKPNFLFKFNEWGKIEVAISRKDPKKVKWYYFSDSYGDVNKKLPKTIKDALGPTVGEIAEVNEREKEKIEELKKRENDRIEELKNKPRNTPEELSEIETRERKVVEYDNEIDNIEREQEEVIQNMSLRDRVKHIFKKYGFTAFAVLSAAGLVIGAIVSNLSKGLTKLGKGVGNGLKALGKKLGEILPGMVGAIVSFLFKTAGQVIGFLGENAWLLIMAVVLYFVEQLKKKRK